MAGILNVYPRQWLVLLSRSLKHLNLLLVLNAMWLHSSQWIFTLKCSIDIQNKNQCQTSCLSHSPKELRVFQKFVLEWHQLTEQGTSLVYTGAHYIQPHCMFHLWVLWSPVYWYSLYCVFIALAQGLTLLHLHAQACTSTGGQCL